MPADDVLWRLLDKLQLHHRLVRPGEVRAGLAWAFSLIRLHTLNASNNVFLDLWRCGSITVGLVQPGEVRTPARCVHLQSVVFFPSFSGVFLYRTRASSENVVQILKLAPQRRSTQLHLMPGQLRGQCCKGW